MRIGNIEDEDFGPMSHWRDEPELWDSYPQDDELIEDPYGADWDIDKNTPMPVQHASEINLEDFAHWKEEYGIELINPLTPEECHDPLDTQYLKTEQEKPQKGYRVKEFENSLKRLTQVLNHKSNLNNK